jgi:hypothetical protein
MKRNNQSRYAKETLSQREKRLAADRLRQQLNRANETMEQRSIRLEKDRAAKKQRIQKESSIEKSQRLTAKRISQQQRIANESLEQRKQRMQADLQYQHEKLASESSEQHAARLQQKSINISVSAKNFKDKLNEFANEYCLICHKLCYAKQLFNVNTNSLSSHAFSNLPLELLEFDVLKMCGKCKKHMTDSHLQLPPANSYWNEMETDHIELPDCINDLNIIEKQLVSISLPNIKFINLHGLYGQAKFHGQVTCLANSNFSDEHVLKILPRKLNDTLLINSNENNLNILKNLKEFSIDKLKVIETLEYLIQHNLKYKHIIIDYNFLNENFDLENNIFIAQPKPKTNINISDGEKAVAVNKKNIKKNSSVFLKSLPSLNLCSKLKSPGQHLNIINYNNELNINIGWVRINNEPNSNYILRGSYNQSNSEMFGRFSGLQCTAMALAAIVYIKCINSTLQTLNQNNINNILVQGNCVYARIIGPHQQIRCLRVNELPQLPCQMYNKLIQIAYDDANAFYGSTLGTTISTHPTDCSFLANLELFFQNYNAGIIICNIYSRAIIKINNDYLIFDSHANSAFSNNAFIIKCETINKLHDDLMIIIGISNSYTYSIDMIDCQIINDNNLNNSNIRNNSNLSHNNLRNDKINNSNLRSDNLIKKNQIIDNSNENINNENLNNNEKLNENEKMIDAKVKVNENNYKDDFLPMENVYIYNQDVNNLELDNVLNIENKLDLIVDKDELVKKQFVNTQELMEEQVWFDLFPMGTCGLNDVNRKVKITTLDYFQTRLMSKNCKFQNNCDYLFYALHQFELERIKSNVNILCKKINHNLVENLYVMEKNLRGTQSYWANAHSDLSAMIRAIGSPTFFCTFSVNDLKWSDLRKALLMADNRCANENISSAEVQYLINKYPIVYSRQIMYRFNLLIRLITNQHCSIFTSKVVDFWWRVEYQKRGSPHLHLLLWLENVPCALDNSIEYIKFIDNNISCKLPKNVNNNNKLYNCVMNYQVHKHNNDYCIINEDGKCRFGFPRPLAVNTHMAECSTDGMEAKDGRLCILERHNGEQFINNYHPLLLELWEANMDIQPCGGSAGLADYVAKYVAKAEPQNYNQQLKLLIATGNNNNENNLNCRKLLHQLSKNLINQREVCASEAAFRLCNLRMKSSSRQIVYLNTRLPHLRTRMLNIRKTSTNDVENTFCTNIVEKYEKRPTQQHPVLANLNLAQFAMLYKVQYNGKIVEDENIDEDAISQEDTIDSINIVNLPQQFKLIDGKTTMIKRNKPAILKHPKLNFNNNMDAFLYHQLLMHLPFVNENEIINIQQQQQQETVEDIFENKIVQLQQILNNQDQLYSSIEEYNRLKKVLEKAIEKYQQYKYEFVNSNSTFTYKLKEINRMADDEFIGNIVNLNEQQLNMLKLITSKIIQNKNNNRMFITGGAGSGKTYLLKMLAQQIIRMGKKIVLASPTGCSAKLINGQTIHSCLLLPTDRNETPKKLSGNIFETMKIQWQQIEFLIIDEISMLSHQQLININLRLKELRP